MFPVIVRVMEEMLRIVSIDLREASCALGVPEWKTIARIDLVSYPQAMSYEVSGGSMASLPGMMYDQVSGWRRYSPGFHGAAVGAQCRH